MLRVFLSHSSADKPFVRELADFLEVDGEIRVWLDEREIGPGENIVLKIGEGLDADAVLLILSPDSVGSRWVKEEWTDAFWDQTNSGATRLAGVLYRDCEIPRLLRNKKYFDLRRNQPEGMREIHTWLLGLRYRPAGHFHAPSRPPIFVGRADELARLRKELAPQGSVAVVAGMPGLGKTTLALEFVHRHQADFEAVYWLACVGRDLAAIAGDLSVQLGVKVEGDLDVVLRELKALCSQKRCLLVFDNVDSEDVGRLLPGGRASVLVTSRREHWDFALYREPVKPEIFNEQECLDLFRKVLGEAEVAMSGDAAKQLFERVGYLPIAVAVAAGLVKHDWRFTIKGLADKLELSQLPDVGLLLKEAIGAASEEARTLLAVMASYAPDGFHLERAAGLEGYAMQDALQELHERALVEEVDRHAGYYRVSALMRQAALSMDLDSPQSSADDASLAFWQKVKVPTSEQIFRRGRGAAVRDRVFISYSHQDEKFVKELLKHLKPIVRAELISCWSDKQIQPGSKWFDEIRQNLALSKVAVLLVTADFLASDFIHEHELGPLLNDAERGGVRILWVLVRACSYRKTALNKYHAVIPPERSLAEMKAERDRAWVRICEEIERAVEG